MNIDIAIIGRGMIGAAAARHLAEAGRSVALIGPDEPSDPQTYQGPFASHHDEGRITRIAGRDEVWTELAARSIARYSDIAARSGVEFHFARGMVAAYPDAPDWVTRAAIWGSEAKLIEPDWLRANTGIAIDYGMPLMYEPAPAGHIDPLALVAAQTTLTEMAGGSVIREVVDSVRRTATGFDVGGAWGTLTASRILLATGAFGADLFGFELDVERRPRTILRAQLADDGRIPSLIAMDPPDGRVEEIYWVPPVRYPDGSVCIKIGGNLKEFTPIASSDLTDWFHTDGDPVEIESLEANLRALLPDAPLGAINTAPCVITGTPSGHPHVGWADDGVAVALAGNGSAAKSSDELGRIAAALFSEAGWDSDIDQSVFAPQLT